MEKIVSFREKYDFLSNIHPCEIEIDGLAYPSVEHAYQAAKCFRSDEAELIRNAKTARIAYSFGRRVQLRSNWRAKRESVMYALLLAKFGNAHLKELLLNTEESEIIAENLYHDRYWGVCQCVLCNGSGDNVLGELLMRVRREIKNVCVVKLIM